MFDDRLATVLRTNAQSKAGERTQYRQLLDLLGTARTGEEGNATLDEAYARLAQLSQSIPAQDQSRILRESGLRLRNPRLVGLLAQAEPKTAASAMATARLTQSQWEQIIPTLPVIARGFLRHRRDLPAGAVQMLRRLGVGDLVLPDPSPVSAKPSERTPSVETPRETRVITPRAPVREAQPVPLASPPSPPASPAPSASPTPTERTLAPISQIIERIEQYRVGRRAPVLAPRLPLGDNPAADASAQIMSFDAVTDALGRATSASDSVAPWIAGMLLTAPQPGPLVSYANTTATALRHHQPILGAPLHITGASQISGEWRLDAAPIFGVPRGVFTGYRCRLRRPVITAASEPQGDSQADKMRQVLHELRTPVGAIQGFAEIIQQQMFGPAPHEYRAHAASIAVDAARLLAGFDELDRLAQLEVAAPMLANEETDFRAVLSNSLTRLDGVLRPRDAGFTLTVSGDNFAINMALGDARQMVWRALATVAGALGAGEKIALNLRSTGSQLQLECNLPAPLHESGDGQPASQQRRPVVSAGIFGPPFALRLARAEAHAAGGTMVTSDGKLNLTLPVLTSPLRDNSTVDERARG